MASTGLVKRKREMNCEQNEKEFELGGGKENIQLLWGRLMKFGDRDVMSVIKLEVISGLGRVPNYTYNYFTREDSVP
jgi:hypothetical protein